MGADEAQIEASFRAAISTAKQQKSISLEKRAETTYAEYVAKNRAGQEGTDSDYLFGNRLQRPFLGPCGRAVRSLTSNSSSAVSRRNRCSKNLAQQDSASIGPWSLCSRAAKKQVRRCKALIYKHNK